MKLQPMMGAWRSARILCAGALLLMGLGAVAAETKLWYERPATWWTEALPVGNGRIGGMVFGGVDQERIQLNEDTLWTGGPYDPSRPGAAAVLPEIRALIFGGKYKEAEDTIQQKFMSIPMRQMQYMTAGDLLLTFPKSELSGTTPTSYRRELDLDTAIAGTKYARGGVEYTREVYVSVPDQVLVVELKASKPGSLTLDVGYSTTATQQTHVLEGGELVQDGVNIAFFGIQPKLKYQIRSKVLATGGTVGAAGDHIAVAGADSVRILVAIATSYKKYDDVSGDPEALTSAALAKAEKKEAAELRTASVQEHQRLFRRTSIDLGSSETTDLATDKRIADFQMTGQDPGLMALYFQYGRYLMICSSRPGDQPSNLQGVWNDSNHPAWGSKYTVNINTEMNYWPVEPTNLGECVEPLTAMVEDLAVTGRRTAEVNYGAKRGWVCHHNTDLWRATGPIDSAKYGMWASGGAWLCTHLWDHYLYTGDKKYLARIYPLMKGASEFFLETLVEEPTHKWLVTCPSMSPEHGHMGGTAICAGPAMDSEIIRDLFNQTIMAGELLGKDAALRKEIAGKRDRLPPNQIGKAGQLQEWMDDWDMEAPDINHRHVSHMYALYPSEQINIRDTPKLAAAARRSLEIRGDKATGWGMAWRLNLWSRLHDGEHAYNILKFMFNPVAASNKGKGQGGVYPNLFDAHPPFQIDGNFGATSGMYEMLMESRAKINDGVIHGEIELLPALPKIFGTGSVHGLRAKGGYGVDITWKEGKLEEVTVASDLGLPLKLRLGEKVVELKTKKDTKYLFDGELKQVKMWDAIMAAK